MSTKFIDSKGRTVTLVKVEDNIAVLDNAERVSVERLRDPRYFKPISNKVNETVMSNTNTMINENLISEDSDISRYQKILAGQKTISIGDSGDDYLSPVQKTPYGKDPAPSSIVKMSGVVEKHRGQVDDNPNTPVTQPFKPRVNDVQNQQNHQETRLSEEEALMAKYGIQPAPVNTKLEKLVYGDDIQKVEDKEQIPDKNINPDHLVFASAKRVHTLNVKLTLDEKIPKKEVIKMMEENFESSAVDYYANDIYRKLMENPEIIESQVKEAIKTYLRSRK